MGEETLELAIKLGGQRLVVTQHQRGLVDVGNDIGNGEGLSGAGDTSQRLGRIACQYTFCELSDGLGLVACGLIG